MIRFGSKLIAAFFGWLMMGPAGLLFGLCVGYFFSRSWSNLIKNQHQTQQIYFKSLFVIIGYLSQADNTANDLSLKTLLEQMDLQETAKHEARDYFRQGQSGECDIDQLLHLLKSHCTKQQGLLRLFIQTVFHIASQNGLNKNKQALLDHICVILGFSAQYYYQQSKYSDDTQIHNTDTSLESDYALLEIDKSVSAAQLKKAYRRLMSQHHPDKMIAQGLPDSMIKLATEKTQSIQAAYERIKRAKGY